MKPRCIFPQFLLYVILANNVHCSDITATDSSYDDHDDPWSTITFDEAYVKGKEAYLENRWSDCVTRINQALRLYEGHRREVAQCRHQCHEEANGESLLVANGTLAFYERAIRDTLCLMKCQKQPVAHREAAATIRAIEDEFRDKNPYDYLQLCYFKANDVQNAASCAYTFLLHNPDHEIMETNFKFYTSRPGIDIPSIRNLDARPYQEFFLKGNEAYNKRNYREVTEYFEAALLQYYAAEEECRLLCEGHFEKAPALDLTMTIANHFTFSLRCKQHCPTTLAYMYGREYQDFLPSHYHYLQYAYFQIGEVGKACEAAATFLLFHPNNETMLHNIEFYRTTQKGIDQLHFTPRKEAVTYAYRDQEEKILLAFVEENFKTRTTATELNNNETNVAIPVESDLPDVFEAIAEASILLTEQQLNGTERFAADGITDAKECRQLMDLTAEAAVHGDGYNGRPTPHTKFETFEGLTVGRAAVLVKMGYISKERVRTFLDVSERSRLYVEKYFHLKKDSLYFSYTHLVCRTATPDSPANRIDLSHPVHADNCVLTNDGKCIKDKPAFTWRDYSSILYLNDDFDGGNFIFAANKTVIQASIRPKCGRMVGFSAGEENLHGVQAVLKGRRCALAMWFTLDHKHREKERFLATQVVEKMEETGDAQSETSPKEDGRTLAETTQALFGFNPEEPNTVYQLEGAHGYQEHAHDDL